MALLDAGMDERVVLSDIGTDKALTGAADPQRLRRVDVSPKSR